MLLLFGVKRGGLMLSSKAIELLRDDNLIWSDDFDNIRHDLANLLESVEKMFSAAQIISSELTDDGE